MQSSGGTEMLVIGMLAWQLAKVLLYLYAKPQHPQYFPSEGKTWGHGISLKVSKYILKTVKKDLFWSGEWGLMNESMLSALFL